MSESVSVELRVPKGADLNGLAQSFGAELKKQNDQLGIENSKEIKPMGMTTPDLIMSVVISIGSSAAVHVYRDQIDAAARAVGKVLNTDVRVLFVTEKKPIDEDE